MSAVTSLCGIDGEAGRCASLRPDACTEWARSTEYGEDGRRDRWFRLSGSLNMVPRSSLAGGCTLIQRGAMSLIPLYMRSQRPPAPPCGGEGEMVAVRGSRFARESGLYMAQLGICLGITDVIGGIASDGGEYGLHGSALFRGNPSRVVKGSPPSNPLLRTARPPLTPALRLPPRSQLW